MKYLENASLTNITARLTDAVVGHSNRVINGRIEAYTMKRAGNDKKIALQLGKRYVAEMEYMEKELADAADRTKRHLQQQQQQQQQKRKQKAVSPSRKGRRGRSTSSGSTSNSSGSKKRAASSALAAVSAAASAPTSRKRSASAATWTEATGRKHASIAVASTGSGSNGAAGSLAVATATANRDSSRRRSHSFDYTLGSSARKTSLGNFSDIGTRKLMTDLILTLQASFPDYDFSYVTPQQFSKMDYSAVRDHVDRHLNEFASQQPSSNFLMEMWDAVNAVIALKECDVYCFEEEELKADGLWTFNYFFVNKSLKRVLFFTCQEKIGEKGCHVIPMEEKSTFSMPAEVQVVDDFDWDPSADVAGGIPISIA
eukprot:CAMPEP_0119562934 /NCGR_PEP_ID=MMETSP1352-20130426/21957_1 /TAXON_ID=265584 /ORGANISM="Stauroneis constricta, Strain CCMP1120" /LENGTH=370 /DNA_ID=CAMNT_0007611445 /DNA_START=388 /DNA_END=1500 /DNA_ORIENTATION=+